MNDLTILLKQQMAFAQISDSYKDEWVKGLFNKKSVTSFSSSLRNLLLPSSGWNGLQEEKFE